MIAVWIAFTYLKPLSFGWSWFDGNYVLFFSFIFLFFLFFSFFSFCALGSFSSQSFLFVSFFFRCDLRRQEVIILVWQPSAFIFFFFFNSKSAFNLNTKKSIAATAHDDWRGLWEIDKIWKQYKIAWYNNMYI